MFNLCWSHLCPLIPKVRRQNTSLSKFSKKINQKGKLQINLDKKKWESGDVMKTAFRIFVIQRNNRTHYEVTCGPCDYFMVRVRASVSIAITLVLGQPYLNIRLHLCVYLGGRCLGQDERGLDTKMDEQK